MTGTKAQVSGSVSVDDGDVSLGSSSLAWMLAPMTGGAVIGAAIGVGQPGATHVQQEVTMTATTQLRIVVPTEARPSRAPAIPDEQVINLTIERDEKLLLSVVEAAHRLGVGRTLMYELLGSGQIESMHVGRLHKVPAEELTAFVERRRARPRTS
jgi:excisionase family DNA binding protein